MNSARYQRIPYDNSSNNSSNNSSDCSMIDFDNQIANQVARNPPLVMYGQLPPNILPTVQQEIMQTHPITQPITQPIINPVANPVANPVLHFQSPIIRHSLHIKRLKLIFLNTILALSGLILNLYAYNDTNTSSNMQIFAIDIKYICNYFAIMTIFYIIYISCNILICGISYLVQINNINTNNVYSALFINSVIFQLSFILRILVMSVIINAAIKNIPMMTITIPDIPDKSNTLNVYMPKYMQYMIIDTIIYAWNSYIIGIGVEL